jgi:hypothetical protein
MSPIANEKDYSLVSPLSGAQTSSSLLQRDIIELRDLLDQVSNDLRTTRELAARKRDEERQCAEKEQRHVAELKDLIRRGI